MAVEINWRGHGKRFNSERAAVEVFHGFEQGEIFLKRNVVGVVRILLDHGDNGGGADEAGEIVYMAMGIVASDSIFQPQDLRDAEIAAENVRVILASESVVTLLALAEQAFFGGEQGTPAVDVDAAAFENDSTAVVERLPSRSF